MGLSTGVVLSEAHQVQLIDIDSKKVDMINQGNSPIYEEGIEELLRTQIANNQLRAITPEEEIGTINAVFIAVGTPSGPDGAVDLSQIVSAVDFLIDNLNEILGEYLLIIMKSTVPPGTTRKYILSRIEELGMSDRIGVVFNPEFLREGSALVDARNPDRTVIGCSTEKEYEMMRNLYAEVIGEGTGVYVRSTLESAELCKYVSNSFLATKISFANEMANIAEKIPGADIDEVMMCVGLDSRISPKFFGSGAGYGGSCFPKDTAGLIQLAKEHDVETHILEATDEVNAGRPSKLVDMLESLVGNLRGKKIAVLGIAFKPKTDDTRYSPALRVIDILKQKGAEVYAHDPLVKLMTHSVESLRTIRASDNIGECLENADGCILVTDWLMYKEMGLKSILEPMKEHILVDGRRVFAKEIAPEGCKYLTVGTYSNG